MNEYEKFTELILEKVETLFKKYETDFRKGLESTLSPVEREAIRSQFNKEEEFYTEVFLHFVEIHTSLENLDYIPVFIKKPFRKSKAYEEAGITRNRYLRYHVEHYIQEEYILLERVKTFLGWFSHQLKNEGRLKDSQFVLQLRDVFEKGMNNIRLLRRGHVHKARFDEERLSRLTRFELASIASQDEEVELVTTFLYGRAKKELSEWIINNNKNLRGVINAIFGALIPIVFPSQAQVVE